MADVGSELQFTDKLGVLKTIYIFLLNNNFENIANIFKTECHARGSFFEGVSTKSIVFRRCRCSKNSSNQTDFCEQHKPSSNKKSNSLDSSLEADVQQFKGEDAQVIYVCDHEKFSRSKTRDKTNFEMSKLNPQKSPRLETMFEVEEIRIPQLDQSSQELVKLKSKFSDLHGEHQRLLAVTSELTNTLQMNIIGQSQNIYYALEQCKTIYPTLFTNNNISPTIFNENKNHTAENNSHNYTESTRNHSLEEHNAKESHQTSEKRNHSAESHSHTIERRKHAEGDTHNVEGRHQISEKRNHSAEGYIYNNTEKLKHTTEGYNHNAEEGRSHIQSRIHNSEKHSPERGRDHPETRINNIAGHHHNSERRNHSAECHHISEADRKHGEGRSHTAEGRHIISERRNHSAEGQHTDRRNRSVEDHNHTAVVDGGRNHTEKHNVKERGHIVEERRDHSERNSARQVEQKSQAQQSSITNSPRLEEQKKAIVDHIMIHSSRTNSPRSPRTKCTNSPRPSEKSILKKEKILEAAHFIHDFNQNYQNSYITQFCEVEPLDLGDSIPEIKHPLTPDTVRHVLDLVFNKIFEIEAARPNTYARVIQSAPLNRDEVKKVVDDVFEDILIRGQVGVPNIGNGEGEIIKSAIQSSRAENEKIFEIDYEKIKKDLVGGDTDRKVRVLQALRWRITKNDTTDRDRVMESYTLNDILDLYSGVCLPERLLNEVADIRVQESMCRLINTVASLRQGRDYLTSEDRLLKRILLKKIKDLRSVSSAVIRNMLLASVQKLSIRKQCRNQMVYEGLLEVLVDYLDDFYEKLSRYSLEYSSALVMNLCLVDEAKERSKRMASKIIGLIRKLLDSEINCCLPYINGIMFSLLEKEEIVNEAIAQNLDKLIIRLIRTTSNENMRKQLDFIVQSRLFGKGDPVSTDNEDDGREEVDLLEIELDEDDFITQMPSGEKLLEEYRVNYWVNPTKPHPESARTYNEETKQFYHKPSSERGIFEGTTPRKYLRPQGLISNFINKKSFSNLNGTTQAQNVTRWSGATPLCYMENCQKMVHGGQGTCTCTKCVPGQSRYSCGCYDVIRKELSEIESREFDTKSSSDLLKTEEYDTKKLPKEMFKIVTLPQDKMPFKKDGEDKCASTYKNSCKICGEKSCDCAFDPRPKLHRTPTKKTS